MITSAKPVEFLRSLGVPANNIDAWQANSLALEEVAQHMRQFSNSHRKCDSGVGSIAWGKNGRVVFLGESNWKPHPHERKHRKSDYCGEHGVIWGAKSWECTEIIGMVIKVPHQPDEKSGKDFGMMVSCYYCRVEFRRELKNARSPLKGHTILLFVNPDEPERRWLTTVDAFLAQPEFLNDEPFIPLHMRGGK